ncbi:MAG: VWA domain-containing protein [Ottowia sp.]|nr:VWA domain-containing protein [Ottowia sp.]
MSYTAEISRSNPTAFIFLVDQSGSMGDVMSSGRSKAQQVADVLNRTLATLITRCTKSEGTRSYFDIGVIGYGGNGAYNGFQGALSSSIIHPISTIESSPLRIEERQKKIDDGAGGVIEQSIKFPVWFEPHSSGGTPMCQAITKTAEELVAWCDSHPDCYPPTVLHITDGESSDGDPDQKASQLRQIQTSDGSVLMFNLHVSTLGANTVEFPASELGLPDEYAKLLFKMSSPLPDHLIHFAREKGFNVGMESRGFMFNADAVQIVDFFDIGTRASQLR